MRAWLVDLLFLELPSCVCQRTACPVHFSTLLVLHVSCPACVQHTAGTWSCPLNHHALHCSLLLRLSCMCQNPAGASSFRLHNALHCSLLLRTVCMICRRGRVACTACQPSTSLVQPQTCPLTAPSPPASSSLSTSWADSGTLTVSDALLL